MGGNRLGTDKDVEKLARAARRAGWDVVITGKNHLKWISPDGKDKLTSALTFGDPRRIKKIRKFLTERGVEL